MTEQAHGATSEPVSRQGGISSHSFHEARDGTSNFVESEPTSPVGRVASRLSELANRLSARLLLRTVPLWVQGMVTLVMVCIVLVVESIASRAHYAEFHPAPLLLAGVVFATLVGGIVAGLICALIAIIYELSFALAHAEDLRYAFGSLIVLLVVAPATALAIGTLRVYAERAGRDRELLRDQRAQLLARELALRETNRRMDVFVSMVTHELKTPLTSLKGSIQLAERQMARRLPQVNPGVTGAHASDFGADPTLTLLRRADGQIIRISRLVDDLLDASRAQSDKLLIRPAPCDLAAVVQETVADLRAAWPTRVITVVVPPDPIPVSIDRGRIAQVLMNYLTNAIKYSPANEPVDVQVHVEREVARVSVRDRGRGLNDDEQQRVWERFHQVTGSEAQSIASGGLGLGLYISKEIVTAHSGQVGVESTPGQGSTFWFVVPAEPHQPL